MKKIFLIISIITALLLLTIALIWTWAYRTYFYTKPLNQQELKNITPDWTKATKGNWSPWHTDPTDPTNTKTWNPTASFNHWLTTIPDQNKAWPILIDTILANPQIFKHEALGDYPDNPEHWNQITTLIQSTQGQNAITQLKKALTRPTLGCGLYTSTETHLHQALLKHGLQDDNWNPNPNPNPSSIDILLPALGSLRNSAHFLKSAAIYELTNNNPDEFVELVQTIYTSAQLANETPIIIGQLVEIAIKATANDLIMWSLEQHPETFTDQHLAKLSSIIEDARIQTFIWQGQALLFRDTIRRTVIDNGQPNPTSINSAFSDGSITSTPSSFPAAQLHPSLQRLFYVHDLVAKQAELRSRIPWDPTLQPSDTIYQQHKDSLNKVSQILMDTLLPALDQAAARFQGLAQQSIAARTLLALHRHKLRHNTFPQALNDLDQDLLTFNPMDIFTGNQLHYQPTNEGPLLYALGNDRDDDQGRYKKGVLSITKPIDADWPMYSNHKLNKLYPDD
ncbi:MAG: hypothetical protein JKY43_01760 [Phycisphaerales bacterium]|nr:hypothetical protein [Phycisphaerales bacterium]